jgi:hypothetical protein
MKLPNIMDSWLYRRRYQIGYLLIVITAIATLGLRISNLYGTDVRNRFELAQAKTEINLLTDAVNLPFKLVHSLFYNLVTENEALSLRLTSISFGLLSVMAVFGVTRRLHSERAGLMAALSMLVSSWFLPVARGGGEIITLVASMALVWAAYSYLYLKRRTHGGLIISIMILAIATYMPLGPLWVALGLVMAPKALVNELLKPFLKRYIAAATVIYLVVVSPLLATFINQPIATIRELLVLPSQMPSWGEFLQRLLEAPLSFLWRSQQLPELRLGRQPVLDLVSLTLATLGILYVLRHWRLKRIRYLVSSTALALIIYALNSRPELLSLFIPIAYITIGMGASRLYRGWADMFPKNNLARYIAVLPLTVVILMSFYYNLKYVFQVMPNTPEVVQTYVRIN